jgi:hypothetical protein
MSLRRQIARLVALAAVLAVCAILPSSAGAAAPIPADVPQQAAPVRATVAQVAAPVREAVAPVRDAVPHDDGDRPHPVADTVAPIAHAAAAPVASTAAAIAPKKTLDERARPHTSHIAATSSGERMSSRRSAHGHAPNGVDLDPSSERSAPAHGVSTALPEASTARVAAASNAPALAGVAPAAATPGGAASGGSGGFFFGGGGFALLVASLLLAGPCLRRRLSELPVVCRPAAFLAVLERPG